MEKLILKEIAQEKTTKQIADTHFISTKTVENHRANICRKLNLQGNNSLLKFAIKVSENL
jgi:DNA-binding CsgD family transcriptional regulator